MLSLAPALQAAQGLARRLRSDRAGVAAVEFAFIAPLMIVLFFGLAQLSQAIVASRHTNHAAASVGDLVAQCSSINDSDFTNIFAAGGDMIKPLPVSGAILAQRVTSVQQTASGAQVQWSEASDTPKLTTSYKPKDVITNLPANVLSSTVGDSIILDQTVYAYNFPVSTGGVIPMGNTNLSLSFGQAINFNVLTYFKPRKSTTVSYTGTDAGGSGASSKTQGTSCYAS